MVEHLNIELMLTYDCNFRCSYCYEKPCEYKSLKMTDSTVQSVKDYISWYTTQNPKNLITLSFWGGEPSLRPEIVKDLVYEYINNDNIDFRIITNGYNIDSILPAIIDCQTRFSDKFIPQISFDYFGQSRRILKFGKPTRETVLKNIKLLRDNRVYFYTKSTILFEDLPKIDLFLEDLNTVKQEVNSENINLALTVDTTATWSKSDLEFEEMFSEFKKSMLRVLQKVKTSTETPDFNWFSINKKLCSAGKNLFAVDIDGSVYMCHGTIFLNSKKDHLLGHISDLTNFSADFDVFNESSCLSCDSQVCFRCNAHCYSRSKKEKYSDRWVDFSNTDKYCRIQKEISKYMLALREITKRNKK